MIQYGIDVGVTGAIACIVNGELHDVRDLPVRMEGTGTVKRKVDSAGMAAIVREWRAQLGVDAEHAVIERVASMPNQGVAGVFSLGHSAGAVEGVMQALGCPVKFVSPVTWKKAIGLGRNKGESRGKASLLYPKHAGEWGRAKDHGRAEAVLIAHYGWNELA